MAVIVAYGSPSLGHVFPLAALLVELAARGHEVHLRTMADQVAAMRAAGLHAEAVDARIEAIQGQDWLARNIFDVLSSSLTVLCERAPLEVEDLTRAVSLLRPDAIIVDANCWGALSAAEAGEVPWTVFSPFTPYLSSQHAPPFGPGFRPLPGPLGRARDAMMRPIVRYLFDRPALPSINEVRAALNLPPVASIDALMRTAPMMLAVGGEPFEYPHPDWADTVHFIGACDYRQDASGDEEWLAAVDLPIVLVGTSSLAQRDARLGEIALRALADEPVHVVVTFPGAMPARLPHTPNSTVRRFVSHDAVLDRAVCVLSHGGMGTTVRALARGVPVCVVPFGRDQAEVARRVHVAGCGTRLSPRWLGPARLRRAVLRAATMTEGAQRVAAGFAATGGVVRGADLIEQRLLSLPGAGAPAVG